MTWQNIYDATGSISPILTDREAPAENRTCKNRDESIITHGKGRNLQL